jgi:hypothetical protein
MAESSRLPSLTILGGPMAGQVLVLDEAVDNVLIGSDPACKFHLALPGVSPIHARIWVDLQGITVYDANSPRGLYINDDRVNGQAPIRNGDVLWLGAPGDDDVVMLQCKVPSQAGEAPPVAETTVLAVEDETMMLAQPPVAAPEPPTVEIAPAPPSTGFEIVEEPAAFEVAPDPDATAFEIKPEPPAPVADAPPPSQAFEIEESHILSAPDEPPAFVPEAQAVPTHFAVDVPAGPLPAVPAFFEDETVAAPAPEPTVAVPPPPPPAPKPAAPPKPARAARPAAPTPAPRPAAPPPAPAAAPAPPRPAATPSPMGRYAAFGAIGLVVVGGGIFGVMQLMKPSAPPVTTPQVTTAPPPTEAPPTLAAQATPPPVAPTPEPVEEAVTIVNTATPPPPTPKAVEPGKPTPPPATTLVAKATAPPVTQPAKGPQPTLAAPEVNTGAQVAGILGQADAALAAHNYDAAAGLYDQALKLDTQNARATTGKTSALAGAAAAKRTFVAGRTSVQGGKAAKSGPSGFDDADVSVSKAPDYSGRIEFEAPKSVRPGESYSVKVFLVNDGKKAFKIGGLSISARANGVAGGGGPAAPPTDKVDPQKRVLLAEVPGVWAEGVNSWSLDVSVTSDHGDAFKNTLTWR